MPNGDIWEEYHQRQRQWIVEDFRAASFCLIATTLERLYSHARLFRWRLVPLAGHAPESAVVLIKRLHDGRGMPPELWAARGYRGYRAAFQKYLVTHAGLPDVRIPDGWHVDHLMSRHRFAPGAPPYHLRLVLMRPGINTSFGAGFEKRFYARERRREAHGGFHMDWITFLKAYGVRLPGVRTGPARWAEWAWDLSGEMEALGEDRFLSYVGISLVLNLGYTGVYRPLALPEALHRLAAACPTFGCVAHFPDPIPASAGQAPAIPSGSPGAA
jgi:hypothetical protein